MYETILVPTDGSEAAAAAVEHALDIATRYGATLHALYVVDVSVTGMSVPEFDVHSVVESLEEEGERATADVAATAEAAGVPCETAVETGVPSRTILDYVDEHGVDLVVMSTHGRTGLDRLLLGSVTERVVRSAPVPVLTVRAPAADRREDD